MNENNIQDTSKESLVDLEKRLKSNISIELKQELKSIKKNSSNLLSYLAIFIASLSVITLGVVLFYGYQYIVNNQKKHEQILSTSNKYENKLEKINSDYIKITEELNNLAVKEQNDFDKLLNLTQQEQNVAIISQAENILNIIANQLINKSNLDLSFNLLKQLNEQLKYYNSPKVNLLKAGIEKDLEKIGKSDYFQTLLKIENISTLPSLVDNLVAKSDQYKKISPNFNNNTQELKWYNRIFGDMANNFKKLFVVYRFNDASSILVSPEQTFYIRENIKLSLQNLIRDYYSSNEKSFKNHLQYVKDNLNKYFKNDDENFKKIYSVLNDLEKINVNSDLLSLLHNSLVSLDEIKKINNNSSLIHINKNDKENQDSTTSSNSNNNEAQQQIPPKTDKRGDE